jgi:hypothetical protein
MRILPARVLETVFYAGIVLSLFSCGQRISDEEAKKIIRQCLKYPRPVFNLTHAGAAGSEDVPRFIDGIEKLAADGYIREDFAKSSNKADRTFLPTDKGRDFVTGVYIRDSFVVYDGAVCKEFIKKIDSIDKEKDQGMTVKFTTGYEPLEPYYSLLCINYSCECFGEKLKKEESRTVRLKRYEKGWRATS